MLNKHLSYSNIAASIALFVALGGTAVAAVTLPRDSVGSPEIRADAVRSPEIQKDAVRSSEIRGETIKVADLTTQAQSALLGDVKVAESTAGTWAPARTCWRCGSTRAATRARTTAGGQARAARWNPSGAGTG